MNSKPLEALSIGQCVFEYLNGFIGKGSVHTIFHRVINISWPDGNLWSISRCDVSNGPANIITNLSLAEDFTRYGIEPGTLVSYDKQNSLLNIGGLSVSLKGGALWKSPLAQHHSPLPAPFVKKNLAEAEGWLRHSSRSSGLTKLFTHLAALEQGTFSLPRSSDPVLLLTGQALHRLLPGIYSADQAVIAEAAASLIGLGPGLTPSGDDYLAGLLLSLAAGKKSSSGTAAAALGLAHGTLTRVILERAPQLTNDISAQMLSLAVQGTGSELMENMVCALFYEPQSGGPSSPFQAARKLSAVGASSGLDQLLGILSGARIYAKISS